MSKPKSQAAEIAAKGFGDAGLTVHIPEAVPVPELIARFQLETEAALKTLRGEMVRMVEGTERRVATLSDEWTAARETIKGLETRVESAIHEMQQAVRECVNAQRESVSAATRAQQSAAVFEKLQASQPDLHRMVADQNKVVAGVRDQLTHARELVDGLSKRLDEFEVVAESFEETQGTVRSLDIHVKDLNTEAQQRRRAGGRAS